MSVQGLPPGPGWRELATGEAVPEGTQPLTVPVTSDGTFVISGLPQGEYKVVVQGKEGQGSDASLLQNIPADKRAEMEKMMAGQASRSTIPFPQKYKALETTDLKCEITDRSQTLNLELKD